MISDNFSILQQIAPSPAAHARTCCEDFLQMSRVGNGAFSASEKITRVLNQHNIKVAHKPHRKVGSFLKRPKDQRKKEDTRSTV